MFHKLIATIVLLTGHYGTYASISVLHQKIPTQLTLNSSDLLSTLVQINRSHSGNHNREKLLLTKDKEVGTLWRSENGDLVKLVPISKEEEIRLKLRQSYERENSLQIAKEIEAINNVPELRTDSLIESIDPTETDLRKQEPSNRQKRTFWPFTSLFGYDYYGPPMGPIYGAGGFAPGFAPFSPGIGPMPPFGGFGVGMLPPPPPLLGLGLNIGF